MKTRLNVRKTYKLFINGEFPRTESGRFYPVYGSGGKEVVANACRGSRKDLRNAVVAARKAQSSWSGKTAYNRGQILYRIAEVCESRSRELEKELQLAGLAKDDARREVEQAIDCWIYYAGWSDKFSQLLGSVNPVAGPYYNFTVPEPTGVVGIVAPEKPALLGLIRRIAPAIVSGNCVVTILSEKNPLPGVTFGEILATSDVPPGVVNLVSGIKSELIPWLASHMDVNAIDVSDLDEEMLRKVEIAAAENVKRIVRPSEASAKDPQSPYAISDFLEMKTVWHPMGM